MLKILKIVQFGWNWAQMKGIEVTKTIKKPEGLISSGENLAAKYLIVLHLIALLEIYLKIAIFKQNMYRICRISITYQAIWLVFSDKTRIVQPSWNIINKKKCEFSFGILTDYVILCHAIRPIK